MNSLRRIASSLAAVVLLLLSALFASSEAMAQQSDLDQVKAANNAYYAALSARDLRAMEQVWSRAPDVVNIAPPVRPAAHVGWDAVKKNYEGFWAPWTS